MVQGDCTAYSWKKETPDVPGLTVPQLETEETLKNLGKRLTQALHKKPQSIAGGPVFTIDPELSERVDIDFIARNAAHFFNHMLVKAFRNPMT
jgi:hypothetical protein